MLIANQKRNQNIAEYLLYMFQVEDMIRAYSFDINLIEQNIISRFDQPYPVRREMREWYAAIIYIMKENKLVDKGHIPVVQSLISRLESFNRQLLDRAEEKKYTDLHTRVRPSITALRARSNDSTIGEIELCLNGLYGLLMLKLTNKAISQETTRAFRIISEFVALLSAKFLILETSDNKN